MASLKTFLPQLADSIGTTPAALYERQRALVRHGIMKPIVGRGPGSGVEGTPENLALLIVAILATDNLSDTDDRVLKLAGAAFSDKRRKVCPLTGASTFGQALTLILAADRLAWAPNILVSRTSLSASIISVKASYKAADFSQFGSPTSNGYDQLEVEAKLGPRAVRSIWACYHNLLREHSPEHLDLPNP
jgi:hypothetical protein